MNKTKQKILTVSKQLFNKQGYAQVTIRMIALEMGISPGNLNYHFKKREEILECLYFEMVQEFDERVEALPETEISFSQIKNDIQTSMERMVLYKFIWTDLFNILKANAKISKHFNEVYPKRISGNVFLFEEIQKRKWMRAEKVKGEYKILAERMVNFGDTWIYTSELYQRPSRNNRLEGQVKAMLFMIYPYLTTKGIQEFEGAFPAWFS